MKFEDWEHKEVSPEYAVHPANSGTEFFLILDNWGTCVVLYGGQLQKVRMEHLQEARIMKVVKRERK